LPLCDKRIPVGSEHIAESWAYLAHFSNPACQYKSPFVFRVKWADLFVKEPGYVLEPTNSGNHYFIIKDYVDQCRGTVRRTNKGEPPAIDIVAISKIEGMPDSGLRILLKSQRHC
ncbi:uncharacterized protein MYCFIDRAFT_76384, partial [Pseudocercospora fijiensis CIRAD86]